MDFVFLIPVQVVYDEPVLLFCPLPFTVCTRPPPNISHRTVQIRNEDEEHARLKLIQWKLISEL